MQDASPRRHGLDHFDPGCYVPADDDPIRLLYYFAPSTPHCTFRRFVELGIYPALDRWLGFAHSRSPRHRRRALPQAPGCKRVLQLTRPADIIAIRGLDELSDEQKRVLSRLRKCSASSRAFFVAAQFTGLEGKYVKLEDTIKGFREIVEGKHDDLPEQAFYMVGTIEEAVEKGKTIAQ